MFYTGGMKKLGMGIRTKFSDDLLWLPYLVLEYINFTGDKNILNLETTYLVGDLLNENQDEIVKEKLLKFSNF